MAVHDPFDSLRWLQHLWFLVVFLIAWAGRALLRARAQSWQPTFGKVEGFLPLRGEPGEPPLAIGYLQYSYTVGSDYFAGEVLVSRSVGGPDLDEMKKKFPSGTSIEVR